ncbi:MAG: nuclear transport factor 2 family protein [Candidatus Dormiibacterota bacterium]
MGSAREVFNQAHERFNAHDLDAIDDIYAEDAEFKGPGGMVFKGRAQIRQFTSGWFQGFPDCELRSLNVIEGGDTIVEEGLFIGTHTGVFPTPMGDIPPTGRRVEGAFVDVFEIRDGLIVADRLSFDRLELMEQLGLMPQPAGAG